MLFTVVTSLAIGFAATLANAAPSNAPIADSDTSDSCDAMISNNKCCFAATVKQDLGNGKVQDWGYVKASKTGHIFVGFDTNGYPQGYFCLQGEAGSIVDGIGNLCDFNAKDGVFSCFRVGEPAFGTTQTTLSDGSAIVALTRDGDALFGICPQDKKQSLFNIVKKDMSSNNGCRGVYLALKPHTPDTCPK